MTACAMEPSSAAHQHSASKTRVNTLAQHPGTAVLSAARG